MEMKDLNSVIGFGCFPSRRDNEKDGNVSSYPLDALLEERCDLALSQTVHELLGRMMGRQQLHAVDEPIKFLVNVGDKRH